ncbi:MAG: radical SAM family heme chaperone HemW [Lachnospiraceae bacterium]|nr:radical SAM family heme chaperone HemW [Lachnospiraceae bacterium]
MQTASELEIYIHVPFCVQKCKYCDFLSFPKGKEIQYEYLCALLKEIESFKQTEAAHELKEAHIVTSVFFGGGTPSLFESDWIDRILNTIRKNFDIDSDAEITLECNPGTISEGYLKSIRKAGVNRLSIGLQSALDKELKNIGRIHTYQDFLNTYDDAVKAGFTNINVDIISALPNQKKEDIDKTLEKILSLNPTPKHISAYSLILEPGTEFMKLYEKGELVLPDEDEERAFHWNIIDTLNNRGYELYELSNMAIPGYECRHNIGYWTGKEYIGFGLGAASYVGDLRFSNTRSLDEYLKSFSGGNIGPIYSESERLTGGDKMSEYMFLGLRLTRGISAVDFNIKFGQEIMDIFGPAIEKHLDEKLLERDGDMIRLTRKGQDVANYVFADFII